MYLYLKMTWSCSIERGFMTKPPNPLSGKSVETGQCLISFHLWTSPFITPTRLTWTKSTKITFGHSWLSDTSDSQTLPTQGHTPSWKTHQTDGHSWLNGTPNSQTRAPQVTDTPHSWTHATREEYCTPPLNIRAKNKWHYTDPPPPDFVGYQAKIRFH